MANELLKKRPKAVPLSNLRPLELEDIQGIVLRGYEPLPAARFVLLSVTDAEQARTWLRRLHPRLRDAQPYFDPASQPAIVNVAFTWEGIKKLLREGRKPPEGFSLPFMEGMVTRHRSRILGDVGGNAPGTWAWGAEVLGGEPDKAPVHILLLLYAINDFELGKVDASLAGEDVLRENGLSLVKRLDTRKLEGRKEQFGFRDGISQPTISGKTGYASAESLTQASDAASDFNTIAPGEIVLGYVNEYGERSASPKFASSEDQHHILPVDPITEAPDFGRNGSYLVLRTLAQDVPGFWKYCQEQAAKVGEEGTEGAVRIASKMVGRWPSGAPMVSTEESDVPGHEDENGFTYAENDPAGYKVPIGSHIRRANPRDSLVLSPAQSLKISKHHRMIRRGRAYGTELHESMDPVKMLAAKDNGEERGLHFIAFVGDIARQFEFVQQMWLESDKFSGLHSDASLTGSQSVRGEAGQRVFTIPKHPVRQQLADFHRFVTVKGGGYFFMPGLRALRYLAGESPEPFTGQANGVFKGGGVKAIALAGAIKVAERQKISWRGLAGTSGGAIVASMLATGYEADDIFGFMSGMGVPRRDGSGEWIVEPFEPSKIAERRALFGIPLISEIANLFGHLGMYNADFLRDSLDQLFAEKGKSYFKDLKTDSADLENVGAPYYLQLIATDITRHKAVIIPQDLRAYDIEPDDFKIADGVRMSMSIPGFFEPVVLPGKEGDPPTVIVDGSFVSDYPMWIFDLDGKSQLPTLGFLLHEGAEPPRRISGLSSLLWNTFSAGWSALDDVLERRVHSGRTLRIDVSGFPTVSRSMTQQERNELRRRGMADADAFFETFNAETRRTEPAARKAAAFRNDTVL